MRSYAYNVVMVTTWIRMMKAAILNALPNLLKIVYLISANLVHTPAKLVANILNYAPHASLITIYRAQNADSINNVILATTLILC